MESTANLMIFCGICRKFYKFHGKQQNAMANLETGLAYRKNSIRDPSPSLDAKNVDFQANLPINQVSDKGPLRNIEKKIGPTLCRKVSNLL